MQAPKSRVFLFCLLSLSMAPIGDVEAARRNKPGRGVDAQTQESLISRDRAAAIARSTTGGRILKIHLKRGKRPHYRVKILVNGKRVRNVRVDARSGAILK